VIEENVFDRLEHMHDQRRLEMEQRHKRAQRRMFLMIAAFLVGMAALNYLASMIPNPPEAELVHINDLRATGPTDLCPGDTLHFAYRVTGDMAAVLDVDHTVWRRTRPQTVIYSISRRMVLVAPVEYERIAAFALPADQIDPISMTPVEWLPGIYELRLALSTTSRNTMPAIAALIFTIREDCPSPQRAGTPSPTEGHRP
jgi:hypothetical protein